MAEYRGHLLRHRQQSRPPRPQIPKGRNGQQVAFNHRAPGLQAQRFNWYSVACSPRPCGATVGIAQFYHLHKTNPMPESTRDRPTRCYEYVFLLTKSKKYYYDWQSVAEPIAPTTAGRLKAELAKEISITLLFRGKTNRRKSTAPAKGRIRRRVDFSRPQPPQRLAD